MKKASRLAKIRRRSDLLWNVVNVEPNKANYSLIELEDWSGMCTRRPVDAYYLGTLKSTHVYFAHIFASQQLLFLSGYEALFSFTKCEIASFFLKFETESSCRRMQTPGLVSRDGVFCQFDVTDVIRLSHQLSTKVITSLIYPKATHDFLLTQTARPKEQAESTNK